MFTKLLLATSAIGALSAPVANYQHTTQEGNVNITYQYETNEVNSPDDLVVGNVYHLDMPQGSSPSDIFGSTGYMSFELINGSISFHYVTGYIDETFNPCVLTKGSHIQLNSADYLYYYNNSSNDDNYTALAYEDVAFDSVSVDIVLFDSYDIGIQIDGYLSSSDYNVITNVQEVYHTGLFGNLADFLRYHIYGGIPHVTDIQFEIANQTITMLDWLVVTTSIALAVLSLVLLFYFFRWVFKLVSGLVLLR